MSEKNRLLAAHAAVAGLVDEDESVRLSLPCRDREVSSISGGVMFDWGLLPPLVLFLFVNRLPGNVVIIVAEASICSFGGGWVGSCPRFKSIFPGADGRPRGGGGGCQCRALCFIYPGVLVRTATRLFLLVPANGSNPAGFNWESGSWVIDFALWLTTKHSAFHFCMLHWVYCSGVWNERHKIHKQVSRCSSTMSLEVRSRCGESPAPASSGLSVCERQFSTLVITRL